MTETLGFLLGDVARLMRKRFDERARSIGATRAQWRTLKVLARHPGINQGRLAELLEVEPITACRMIDRLEESALVERRRDPADRRAWRIHLTDKADPILTQLKKMGGEMIEEALDGLDLAQRDQLFAALDRIRANLNTTPQDNEAANG